MRDTIRILSNDIDLMMKLAKYTYLDSSFIVKNCYSTLKERTIRRRLRQLVVCGYIESKWFFFPPEISMNSSMYVYTLSKKGVDMLDKGLQLEVDYTDINRATPYYVYHQMMLAHAVESLVKAINLKENTKVVEVLNEYESYETDAYVRPDSSLIIQFNGVYIIIFIELERSWTTDKKIIGKIRRYNLCQEESLYKKITSYDVKDSRVLFVSSENSNPDLLLTKIINAKPSVDILVCDLDDVVKNAGDRIYYGIDKKEHVLFARLPKLNSL